MLTTPRTKQHKLSLQTLQAHFWSMSQMRDDKITRLCDFYWIIIKISVVVSVA